MGKPAGDLSDAGADQLAKKDEDYHAEVSEELAKHIKKLIRSLMKQEMRKEGRVIHDGKDLKILAVGPGKPLGDAGRLGS